METALFDFDLPPGLIAQEPVEPRDASRLLVLDRHTGAVQHARFSQLPSFLDTQDLLVNNDTRVGFVQLPARKTTGGRAELTLLRALDAEYRTWSCLIRGTQMVPDRELILTGDPEEEIRVRITDVAEDGTRHVVASQPLDPETLARQGRIPLPPYIKQYTGPRARYQTVYARTTGSVAAPTAGLHFTPRLLREIRAGTAGVVSVTLHVGRDTFAPVRACQIEDHGMQGEQVTLAPDTADAINRARARGGRIISVGTTTTRTLEWAVRQACVPAMPTAVPAVTGWADLYIWPGFEFRVADAIVTNLHLPRSTPLFLISAFIGAVHADVDVGRRLLLAAYQEAMREDYRFYSFGDAMLVL